MLVEKKQLTWSLGLFFFTRNKSSLQSWVLPCYQPHLCIYLITNTLLLMFLVFLEFHLISFFGENDLCAFFPSRLHIYVQDFVPDTGSISICIQNLLKKQINLFHWARLPLLFPRVGQLSSYPARYLNLLCASQVEVIQGKVEVSLNLRVLCLHHSWLQLARLWRRVTHLEVWQTNTTHWSSRTRCHHRSSVSPAKGLSPPKNCVKVFSGFPW